MVASPYTLTAGPITAIVAVGEEHVRHGLVVPSGIAGQPAR
jgi:hypothetical protein